MLCSSRWLRADFADFEPFLLGLEEIECLGDDLGGGGEMAADEFALDALFGRGIEVDRHRQSIPLGWLKVGMSKPILCD